MKTIKLLAFFIFFASFASFASAAEWEDDVYVIDLLLSLSAPGAPVVFDNVVVFSASSNLRRAGVAFAHEGFSRVHWMRQLLVPAYFPPPEEGDPPPPVTMDSGILFHILEIPRGVTEIEYRLVIDGLWTTDPANPNSRRDRASGLNVSVVPLPNRTVPHDVLGGPPGSLSFLFRGNPGDVVTVAGSFNGWDPFMFRMREGPAGVFSLNLPLPPGVYQYVFFRQGRRYLDEYNHGRAYAPDGRAVSVIMLP
ncbi:MAG: isoamylase [Spirochaetes bacterium]|nr:isoamylase [Spirochaetota bacterium]